MAKHTAKKSRRRTAPPGRKYSPRDVVDRLATIHDLRHPDGSVNYSEFGRRCDLPPSTISRIHRGTQIRDDRGAVNRGDEWVMTSATIGKLMNAFHITFAEASGADEIPIDQSARRSRAGARSSRVNPDELELLAKLRALSASAQRDVRSLIEIKHELEHPPQPAPDPRVAELEQLRDRLKTLLGS